MKKSLTGCKCILMFLAAALTVCMFAVNTHARDDAKKEEKIAL